MERKTRNKNEGCSSSLSFRPPHFTVSLFLFHLRLLFIFMQTAQTNHLFHSLVIFVLFFFLFFSYFFSVYAIDEKVSKSEKNDAKKDRKKWIFSISQMLRIFWPLNIVVILTIPLASTSSPSSVGHMRPDRSEWKRQLTLPYSRVRCYHNAKMLPTKVKIEWVNEHRKTNLRKMKRTKKKTIQWNGFQFGSFFFPPRLVKKSTSWHQW